MDDFQEEIDSITDEISSDKLSAPWSEQSSSKPQSESSDNGEDIYEKLKEYETKRRSVYSSKLDSMSLYWKSYKDLLSASLHETGRAERLVLGTCQAHHLYSDALKAIHDDVFLDEKGNVVNEKQQKRLASSRKKEGASNEVKTISVVKEIQESHGTLGNRFEQSSKNMDEEIAEAIQSLNTALKTQFSEIESIGTSIIEELEKTEQEVTGAWATYIEGTTISGNHMISRSQDSSPRNIIESDPWIVEMQYRVCVAYQNKAWEEGNAKLIELFAKVKQEECARRMNLREFLVAFVQRQQRLFSSLPGIQNKSLEDLVGKEISLSEMEMNVQATIDEQAAKHSADLDSLAQHSPSKPTSTDPEDEQNVFQKIGSPLLSDLLLKAKVVERKSRSSSNQGWQTSLAIITADSFLHLFDIVSKSIIPGSSPDIAFKTLVPPVLMPTSERLLSGKSNFSRGWGETLTPTESLILANCSFQRKNETCFELMEKINPKSMFGKIVNKKVMINTSTKEEADDWISVLTGEN